MPALPSTPPNGRTASTQDLLAQLLQPSQWVALFQSVLRSLQRWWSRASSTTKFTVVALGGLYALLAVAAFVIGPTSIAQHLASLAGVIGRSERGKLYLLLTLIITSIPPLPGYGSAVTLCGLAFGSPKAPPIGTHTLLEAWIVAASGCLLGASLAFILLRWIVRGPGRGWESVRATRDNRRWKAMEAAVRARGTGMVVLIRFCPFPFCYSNLFFAAMDSVSLLQFVFATALITPKLLLHVYIGARMFELLDEGARAHLDWRARILNAAYIIIGSIVGFGTGWYVWRETQSILAVYDAEEGSVNPEGTPRPSASPGSSARHTPAALSRSNSSQAYALGGSSDDEDTALEPNEEETRLLSSGSSGKTRTAPAKAKIPTSAARSASASSASTPGGTKVAEEEEHDWGWDEPEEEAKPKVTPQSGGNSLV